MIVRLYDDGQEDGLLLDARAGSYGQSDIKFVIETLNSGRVTAAVSDMPEYNVCLVLAFSSNKPAGDA